MVNLQSTKVAFDLHTTILKRVLILFIAITICELSHGQTRLGAFVGGGTFWYQGDLQESAIPVAQTMSWSGNAGLWLQLGKRWNLELNYTIGSISGDDQYADSPAKQARSLKFTSIVHQVSLRSAYEFLRRDKFPASPYLSVGIGALNFGPERDGTALQPLQTEGVSYKNWTLAFPLGLGVKWMIRKNWAMKLEANYHFTLSDYLDDVSGAYPEDEVPFYTDPGDVSDSRESRGNPSQKDGIWDINLGVMYFFTGKRLYQGKNTKTRKLRRTKRKVEPKDS